MQGERKEKMAVFVDMDNVSATALEIALSRWRFRQTEVVLRRAYGGLDKLKGASTVLQRYGFHVRANQGKGTTDVLMTIDVMDALHAGLLPSVVAIASSDGDFVPLAWRLRDAGLRVLGVAEHAIANDEVLTSAYHDVEWCDVPGTVVSAQPALTKTVVKPVVSVNSIPQAIEPKKVSTSLVVSNPVQSVSPPSETQRSLGNVAAISEPVSPKVIAIVQALQPWLPLTVKQLNQAGSVLREKKLVSGHKPLHEHFRQFPDFFKVLPPTGPARSVKLLKAP